MTKTEHADTTNTCIHTYILHTIHTYIHTQCTYILTHRTHITYITHIHTFHTLHTHRHTQLTYIIQVTDTHNIHNKQTIRNLHTLQQ